MSREIVISGISGRYPESESVAEFSQKLFDKVDLTSDSRRWKPGVYGLPRKLGQLKDLSKFDNEFFCVCQKLADTLDPQIRILLETTHESIVDAGYDPKELRGRNIGVFIANTTAESYEILSNDPKKISGYTLIGGERFMLANFISYTFDFKGPSIVFDTGCSSGITAINEAVDAIQNNKCESAIVGGANICLKTALSLALHKLNVLSEDGACKSFDAAADGFCRSEAVVAMFLQKSDVARRNYATIMHIKTNTDGFKEQGVFHPSAAMQKKLLVEVYNECKLNPLDVCYVETHGPGTLIGDPEEISSISDIFCPGRANPLLVGSVKSNMGHSEAASGLCGITKLIISMENSLIPPNLHFNKPNPNIKSLVDGKVKIVTTPTPLEGDYVSMCNYGLGGTNAHIVLKSNTNKKNPKKIKEMPIPQLVLYSGRTESGVQYLFDSLTYKTSTREFFALLHKSVYSSTIRKPYRGYKLLLENHKNSEIKKVKTENRPLWYIFPGLGTQWPCMATQLMNLEVFANSIRRSAAVLKPYDLDLVNLLTNKVEKNIVAILVAISAVQIALVDVLKEIGITPDGIIGHSMGELACAYADGSLTAEQALLSVYWRGKIPEDSDLASGAMAVLGITWLESNKKCPKDVFTACHNAKDSVTISGPKNSVKKFVEGLKTENVSAHDLYCGGYAWHSQYMRPAAPKLQISLVEYYKKCLSISIIKNWYSSCKICFEYSNC